jgi:hypothetical protein
VKFSEKQTWLTPYGPVALEQAFVLRCETIDPRSNNGLDGAGHLNWVCAAAQAIIATFIDQLFRAHYGR